MIPRRKEPAAKEAPASAASSSALAAPVRPLGTEEIVEVMRQEIAGPDGAPRDLPAPAAMQLAGLRTEAASLAELLGCDGPDFVALAYRTILRRNPDPEGTRYILDALAGGRTKVEMLGNLRYSPEGRRVRHPLPGLWLRYQAQRAYRAPVLGAGLLGARDVALGGRDARRRAEEMRRAAAAHAEAQAALQARLGAVGEAVSRLERALEEQRREFAGGMDRATQRLAGLEAAFRREPWADPILSLSDRTEDFERRLEALEMQLRNATDLVRALRAVGDEQGWSAEGSGENAVPLADRLVGLIRDGANRARRIEAQAETTRRDLADQRRRLSLVLEELRRRPENAPAPEGLRRTQEHLLDDLYVSFEDRFRGTREDIKRRQEFYLPILAESGAGGAQRPVLDVGPGRGEWLELLRERGLTARGVDLNEAMVAQCAGLGLDCVQGDAVEHLSGLPDDTLGAVTGFHIIEHLPFRRMVALFDEALRVLRPGGLVIFETPNPANLLVASRWFHLDPTHRNPLPGEMVAMVAEARGFVRVSIVELHPMRLAFEARDTLLAEQLDRLFHGPQDYALIARKA